MEVFENSINLKTFCILPDLEYSKLLYIISSNLAKYDKKPTNNHRQRIILYSGLKKLFDKNYDHTILKEFNSENMERIFWMWKLSKHCTKQFVEISCVNEFKKIITQDEDPKIEQYQLFKQIMSRYEPENYNNAINKYNLQLTLQGFVLENFIYHIFLIDMKFKDKIDSYFIAFNSPSVRLKIRSFNRKKTNAGIFYKNTFNITKFCLELLERFFPVVDYIWCDWHHFTHCEVLKLTMFVQEYGFFDIKDVEHQIAALLKVVKSLNKLEYAWNEKYEKAKQLTGDDLLREDSYNKKPTDTFELRTKLTQHQMETYKKDQQMDDSTKNIPTFENMDFNNDSFIKDTHQNKAKNIAYFKLNTHVKTGEQGYNKDKFNKGADKYEYQNMYEQYEAELLKRWEKSRQSKEFREKAKQVADNLAKCKEYIACIVMQIITLSGDYGFSKIRIKFNLRRLLTKNDKEFWKYYLPYYFPFHDNLLEILLGYLTDSQQIGDCKINSDTSRRAVENCFLYICTVNNDQFQNSQRSSTKFDLKQIYLYESVFSDQQKMERIRKICREDKYQLVEILNNLSKGLYFSANKIIDKIKQDRTNDLKRQSGIFDQSGLQQKTDSQRSQDETHKTISLKKETIELSDVHYKNIDEDKQPSDRKLDVMSDNENLVSDVTKNNLQKKNKRNHTHDLLGDLKKIRDKISKGMAENKEYKLQASLCGIPTLLLAVMDYSQEQLNPTTRQTHKDITFTVNDQIQNQMLDVFYSIFDQLYEICTENSEALAQVFKGDGLFHLIRQLVGRDLATISFLNRLTSEDNIADYFQTQIFSNLLIIYKTVIDTVIGSFSENIINSLLCPTNKTEKKEESKQLSDTYIRQDITNVLQDNIMMMSKSRMSMMSNENKKRRNTILMQDRLKTNTEVDEDTFVPSVFLKDHPIKNLKTEESGLTPIKETKTNTMGIKLDDILKLDSQESVDFQPAVMIKHNDKEHKEKQAVSFTPREVEMLPAIDTIIKTSPREDIGKNDEYNFDKMKNKLTESTDLNNPIIKAKKQLSLKQQKCENKEENLSEAEESDIEYDDISHKISELVDRENQENLKYETKMRFQKFSHKKEENLSKYHKDKNLALKKLIIHEMNVDPVKKQAAGSLFSFFLGLDMATGYQIPHINNPDFDVRPYLFQIMMNKFWNNLFKKKFTSNQITIRNMLAIQEKIYHSCAYHFIPIMLKIIQNEDRSTPCPDELIHRNLFISGNEKELINKVLKRKTSQWERKQLQLKICVTILRVLNQSIKSVFSQKVMETLEGTTKEVIKHLNETDFHVGSCINPFGIETEMIKLTRYLYVNKEAGWLIDKKFTFKRKNLELSQELQDFVINLMSKTKRYDDRNHKMFGFMDETSFKDHVIDILLDGLLPLIYKYISSIYNLTDCSDRKDLDKSVCYMLEIINKFDHNNDFYCELTTNSYSNKMPYLMGWTKYNIQPFLNEQVEFEDIDIEEIDINILINIQKYTCTFIMERILKYYEGFAQYIDIIKQYQEITQDQYKESISSLVFVDNFKVTQEDEENIKPIKKFYDVMIRKYFKLKTQYTTSADRDLLKFFGKNQSHMSGIIESCFDLLLIDFQRSAKSYEDENFEEKRGLEICYVNFTNISECQQTHNFFTMISIPHYLEFLSNAAEAGMITRKMFFDYITGKNDLGKSPEYIENYRKIRPKFFNFLIRLNFDLQFFLLNKPTINDSWWIIYKYYVLVNSFWKGMCEGNYLKMKQMFGTFESSVLFDNKSYPLICLKIKELKILLNSSQINTNLSQNIIQTDNSRKFIPQLITSIEVLTELVGGPCEQNIELIKENCKKLNFFKIIYRVISDLKHPFYELKSTQISFLLALCETTDRSLVKSITRNLATSNLENLISKLMKKMFIRQKIRDEVFFSEFDNAKIIKDWKYEQKQAALIDNDDGQNIGSTIFTQSAFIATKDALKNVKHNSVVPVRRKNKRKATILEANQDIINIAFKKVMIKHSLSDEIDPHFVPDKMDDHFKISTKDQLLDYYKSHSEFSTGILFNTVFSLLELWNSLSRFSVTHKNRLDEIQLLAYEYNEMITLNIFKKNSSDLQHQNKYTEMLCIFQFLFEITEEIEVKNKSNMAGHTQVKIKFPRRPETFLLNDKVKENYMTECSILDSNKKMSDLMRMFGVFCISMEQDLSRYRSRFFFSYNLTKRDRFDIYIKLFWVLGVINNILLMNDIKLSNPETRLIRTDIETSSNSITNIRHGINYTIFVLAGVCLTFWILFLYRITRIEKIQKFEIDNPYLDPNTFKNKIYINLWLTFQNDRVNIALLIHIISGAIIIINYNNMFFFNALHLMTFFCISETARSIMYALYLHWDQFVVTFILMLFWVYLFTIIIMEYLSQEFTDKDMICDKLYKCQIYVVDYGIRWGEGIGEFFEIPATGDSNFRTLTAVEFFFWLIINLLFLNIVYGIIVDTFQELRTEAEKRLEDKINVCFVCGLTRVEFNKRGKNFDDHQRDDHNLWKYVYFLYYLKSKGEDRLNGIEQICWNDYIRYKTDWIPIGKTSYQSKDYDETNELKKTQTDLNLLSLKMNNSYHTIMDEILEIKNGMGIKDVL